MEVHLVYLDSCGCSVLNNLEFAFIRMRYRGIWGMSVRAGVKENV